MCYVNKSKLNKKDLQILTSYTSQTEIGAAPDCLSPIAVGRVDALAKPWIVLGVAVFLVSIPVLVQAPLVRLLPGLSLIMTGGWVLLSWQLLRRPATSLWGDLLLGFTWSWLAGSIYWGWLRWEPTLHLPVEAIGVPFAIWCLVRQWGRMGSCFYLGSLLGTAVTDLYFYLVGLISHWRRLMQVEAEMPLPILQEAVAQVRTPWGIGCAITLLLTLTLIGGVALRSRQLHWWAFGGAVLGTILVDGLFWLAVSRV